MKIQINEKNEILSYVEIGDLNNSVEFNGTIPAEFWQGFTPYFYMLKNDEIVENPDYVEPIDTPPVIVPSKQDKINAQIMLSQAKQKAEQDKFNAEVLLKLAGGMK